MGAMVATTTLLGAPIDPRLSPLLPEPDWRADDALDLLDLLYGEHVAAAPQALKDRFYGAISPTIAGDALAHLARVRFGKRAPLFTFDKDGEWAIVGPIIRSRLLVNWGAVSLDGEKRATCWLAGPDGFAVNIEEARLDAHQHPKRRLFVHASPWSWLRAECVGALPVDWREFSLFVDREGYDITGTSDAEIAAIKAHRRRALPQTKYFVREDK